MLIYNFLEEEGVYQCDSKAYLEWKKDQAKSSRTLKKAGKKANSILSNASNKLKKRK
jgi:hypothetical protein